MKSEPSQPKETVFLQKRPVVSNKKVLQPKPSQPVSKAHSKKLAEIQTAVSISHFLCPASTLYPARSTHRRWSNTCSPKHTDTAGFVRETIQKTACRHTCRSCPSSGSCCWACRTVSTWSHSRAALQNAGEPRCRF